MKAISTWVIIIAICIGFLSLVSAFSLILFLIFKGILVDVNNVDVFEIIIRASFVLIGSFLSGFIAFFIFFLNFKKDQKEKEENQRKYLKKINDEHEQNIKILKSINEAIINVPSDQLFILLNEEKSEIKELILIQYSKINSYFYKTFSKEITEENYVNHAEKWNKVVRVNNYLDLLINKVTHSGNASTLIDEIKKEISTI